MTGISAIALYAFVIRKSHLHAGHGQVDINITKRKGDFNIKKRTRLFVMLLWASLLMAGSLGLLAIKRREDA